MPHPVRNVAVVLKRSQQDDPDLWAVAGDLVSGIDAVEHRHHDVEHRHVGSKLPDHLDRRPAVGRLGDHLETVLREQRFDTLTQHLMIIREDYPNGHRASWGYPPSPQTPSTNRSSNGRESSIEVRGSRVTDHMEGSYVTLSV